MRRNLRASGNWPPAAGPQLGCGFERALALLGSDVEPAMREALVERKAPGAVAFARRCRDALCLKGAKGAKGVKGLKGVGSGPRASTVAHPAGLTQREAQILGSMAQGLTNAEIAARIHRSAKTIDHHISAILGKLQARSRAEASAMAAQLGLVDPGSDQ